MSFVLPTPRVSLPRSTRWPGSSARGAVRASSTTPVSTRRPSREEIVIASDGGPYLSYTSTIRLITAPSDTGALDDEPPAPVWHTESGYWRISAERPTTWGLTDDQHPVELLIADPSGHVAVYIGAVGKGRIDLVSDVIARVESVPTSAPASGSTAWSTASSCGRTTSPRSVTRCSPTPPAASRASRPPPTTRPDDHRRDRRDPFRPRRAPAARQPAAGPPRRGPGLRSRRRRRVALRRPDGRAARAVPRRCRGGPVAPRRRHASPVPTG